MTPNMSYCRFRNTLTALIDCRDSLENDEPTSEEEKKALANLIDVCHSLVNMDLQGDLDHIFGEIIR